MRKVSMATRRELIEAVGALYRSADRASEGKVLDEFVAITGFHRKHAMRLLRAEPLIRKRRDRSAGFTTRRYAERCSCCGRPATAYAASGCGRLSRF